MEIKNFSITKRDGSKEQFSLDKIMNAILKAFDSVKQPVDLGAVSKSSPTSTFTTTLRSRTSRTK